VLAPSKSLVADQLLDVLISLSSCYTSGKVTASLSIKFKRCDCTRAGKRVQTWARWFGAKPPVLATGVGKKLLLIHVHLLLNFVLSVA
jgi:hypothetical protein